MSALKSHDLNDYRTANILDLRGDRPLPCDVYLYFEQNKHLILWQRKDYVFLPEAFEKYLEKGLKKVWIYKEDAAKFEEYLAPAVLDPAPAEVVVIETNMEVLPDPADVLEITARYLITLLRSALYKDRQKRALVAKAVRIILGRAASATTVKAQQIENFKVQELVRELLTKINHADRSTIHQAAHQIWKFSETDPTLTHGLNVASYATLIGMAFGRINEELISDIGTAALVHDIGISQLPISIASAPRTLFSEDQETAYQKHVPDTLDLFSGFLSELSPRVISFVEQTHEAHDGSGFPHQLRGTEVHEVSQLISIADLLDTVGSGLWDGKERTFSESLKAIADLEENSELPFPYNPEVFGAIARWIQAYRDDVELPEDLVA